MIDSHCHLNADDYLKDLDEVVARASEAGVHGILVPGIDIASCRRALEIAERHPTMIRVAVGIHPHAAAQWNEGVEQEIREMVAHDAVVAIGEIGLDFYRDWCPFPTQRRAYSEQLRLARELGLPVVIHDRQAHEEVLHALEDPENEGLEGVLHCFSGGSREADRAIALGFHISFTGSLTYAAGKADSVLRHVAPERLLLETDSPYMTPVPHRGQRNEPAFVVHVAEALARKVGRSQDDIEGMTNRAASKLFGFPNERP
jgi:TatD DNase family protein